MPTSPVLVPADSNPPVHAFGGEVMFLLTSEQTGGSLTQWIETTPPGGGPPPHWHEREDEWFHVLEGRGQLSDGGSLERGRPGSHRVHSEGAVHAFKNVGDTPLRMLISTSPSGFETFFTRCAAEFDRPGGPDMQRITEIAGDHGIHFAG